MQRKHIFIMLICCLVPIGAWTALSIFNVPLNTLLLAGVILLCPILHLVMMKSMMHNEEHEHVAERLPESSISSNANHPMKIQNLER